MSYNFVLIPILTFLCLSNFKCRLRTITRQYYHHLAVMLKATAIAAIENSGTGGRRAASSSGQVLFVCERGPSPIPHPSSHREPHTRAAVHLLLRCLLRSSVDVARLPWQPSPLASSSAAQLPFPPRFQFFVRH